MPDHTTVSMKRCSKCGELKPATNECFFKHKRSQDGLCSYCKVCHGKDRRAYYEAHWEELREKRLAYNLAIRDRRLAYNREYYQEHLEQIRNYRQKYREANQQKIKESKRKSRLKHAEEKKKKQRQYRDANRDLIRRRDKQYRQTHRSVVKANYHRRKARKRSLPNTLTNTQIQHALHYWSGKCAYCERNLGQLNMFEDVRLHLDHFIPLSDRRSDNPGTVATNMLPACAVCNEDKRASDPIEWLIRRFGKRKANRILARINEYFASLAKQIENTIIEQR